MLNVECNIVEGIVTSCSSTNTLSFSESPKSLPLVTIDDDDHSSVVPVLQLPQLDLHTHLVVSWYLEGTGDSSLLVECIRSTENHIVSTTSEEIVVGL